MFNDTALTAPVANGGGTSHKKIIYLVRHAEATHNVKEREAVQAAIAAGETDKEGQDKARKAVLREDASLLDAPLSKQGTEQARSSGKKLETLFGGGTPATAVDTTGAPPSSSTIPPPPPSGRARSKSTSSPLFRPPDVVLVSPLRRALMTATELFYHQHNPEISAEPPLFLAIEALREKRTGFLCDERCVVDELKAEFPHVDFTDVERGIPAVPTGEDNEAVRARAREYLDTRLAAVPGQYLAVVSHKGWLREFRKTLSARVQQGLIRADVDVEQWDTTLFGNAEVRVAAFRWDADGQLQSIVSRSVDNAIAANAAAMMGDGFEFALGQTPTTGFSMFLADRTTKVHFISIAEGRHNVAIRQRQEEEVQAAADAYNSGEFMTPATTATATTTDTCASEAFLMKEPNRPASEHPLFDARLTRKGARQAEKLRDMLAQRPSGGRPFTAFDLVLVSPLTRACETAQIIFGQTPGTYGGIEVKPPRIVVREECRERFGKYVCDARRTVTELEQDFCTFDFSEMPSNEDVWHDDEVRETALQVQDRSVRLLEWLSARPERCVAVVTHSEFLRHLFGQFGDTLEETDRSSLQRPHTAGNCELRSVVLCSHGTVEREKANAAPPSTVRIPSSSSFSSLAALAAAP